MAPPEPPGSHQADRSEDPSVKFIRSTTKATWFIFAATAVAAGVGIAQWFILSGTLDEMRADQRPWVGLSGITTNPTDSSAIVAIKNGGKSPALNVRLKIFGHPYDGKAFSIPTQPCDDDCTFRGIEMLPDVQLSDRIPRTGEILPQSGTPIWLGVRADYEDANGRPYKTYVCLIQKGPMKLSTCPDPKSNYAD
jgi:hypothetical protein